MEAKTVNLIPYLLFEGNCEEALNYYREILDGELEIVNRYDRPEMNAPENYRDKVLHARLRFGGQTIYASDMFPGQSAGKSNGNVALSLEFTGLERAKETYGQLAEGGQASVPFEKQFWGGWHGNLTDRFGINWMVSCED